MCEHMKPRSYKKFNFSLLFDDQRCPVCNERFAVPLKQQYLAIALSVSACVLVIFCQVYLTDPVGRLDRFLLQMVTVALCAVFPHHIGYGVYLRAFRRAQAAMPKSTETT